MNTRIKTAAFVLALFALSSFGPLGQTAKAHTYAKSNQPDRVQVSQQFRAAATIGAELAGRRTP